MPTLTGKPVPAFAKEVILSAFEKAGVETGVVTSVGRSAGDQARIMYTNLTGSGPQQGVAAQLALYLQPGKDVIEVYVQNKEKSSAEVIELMRQKIEEVGPSKVSHHCCDPSKLAVIDLGPSSIQPQSARPALESALSPSADSRIAKFLSPHTSDPAYHVEIPLPQV
jgi:hypothetical protein